MRTLLKFPRHTPVAALAFFAVFAVLAMPHSAQAATSTWNTTNTGLWSTASNWNPGVPAAGDTAQFNGGTVNGNQIVQLGADATIAAMIFDNTGTTQLQSSSSTARTLTLGGTNITVSSGAGAVTIGDATNVLNMNLNQQNTLFTLEGTNGLTFVNTLANNMANSTVTLTVNGPGALTLAGFNLGRTNSGGKTAIINGSANVQIHGVVANNSLDNAACILTYSGTGTLTLSGSNTYTGTTVIGGGGTVSVGNIEVSEGASNLGNSTNAVAFAIGNGTAGKLSYTGNSVTFSRGIVVSNANTIAAIDTTTAGQTLTITNTVAFSSSTQTLVVGGAGNTTIHGNITGNGRITKNDAGTLLLTGSNGNSSFKNTINGGTLQYGTANSLLGGSTSLWTTSNIAVASGATMALNVGGTGEFTAANVTTLLGNLGGTNGGSAGGFAAGANVGFDTANASGGSFTITNNLANSSGSGGGALGLAKSGAGTLILSGSNSYTGQHGDP